MAEGTYPMNLDLNAGGELLARPVEQSPGLRAQHLPMHLAPEFGKNIELERSAWVRANRPGDRLDQAG